jgi:hypothetical protein
LLACQEILKTHGLGVATLAQCEPLIDAIPTAAIRQEFRAYLHYQLETAQTLGLDQVGVPISSDTIESLFGVGKRHGVGETLDAARIALRLPAFCGLPTRQEAEQVLGVSVPRQHEFTAALTSLTQQRREVLSRPGDLESLHREPNSPHWELIPSPKTRANNEVSISIKATYENNNGTRFAPPDESMVIEHTGPHGCERIALTF